MKPKNLSVYLGSVNLSVLFILLTFDILVTITKKFINSAKRKIKINQNNYYDNQNYCKHTFYLHKLPLFLWSQH